MRVKSIILSLVLFVSGINAFCQDSEIEKQLLEAGVEHHDKGEYKQAIEMYDKVLAMNPKNMTALYEKAFSLHSMNDYDNALKTAKALVKLDPSNANTYCLIANIYDDMGKPKNAMKAYQDGLEINSGDQMLNFNLGIAYYRQGDLKEAESYLKTSFYIDPSHPGTSLNLGKLHNNQNEKYAALTYFAYFLMLENLTERSANVMEKFREWAETDQIMLPKTNINPNNLLVSMSAIASKIDKDSLADEYGLEYAVVTKSLQGLLELEKYEKAELRTASSCSDIPDEFMMPLFKALKDENVLEPFCHWITLASGNEKNVKWVQDNEEKIKQMVDFVNSKSDLFK